MTRADNLTRKTDGGGTAELRTYLKRTILDSASLNHELDRLTRYQLNWNFYQGKHWKDYNETLMSFNYVRAMVDKVNIFLLGKEGFSITIKDFMDAPLEEGRANIAERLLNKTWIRNKKVEKIYETFQMGSICGDAFMLVEYLIQEKVGKLTTLDSRHCFPEFLDGDINTLKSFTLRFPLATNTGDNEKFVLRCVKYTNETKETWFQKDTADEKRTTKYNGTSEINTYGFIPIVHFKNNASPGSYYSTSDCDDLVKLNKVYNELSQEIKGIIDYYSTPTTVVTGATLKTVKRGLGNIWSGLPSEANVFNLGLDVDLGNAQQYLANLKLAMHELSGVPETALGQVQPVSNTSAAALQITYQPLVQKADQKAITYGQGIEEVNRILLRYEFMFNSDDVLVQQLGSSSDFRAVAVFPYGFPKDRINTLQEAQLELSMNLNSRRNIMESLGINNVDEVMEEIDADVRRQADNDAYAQGEIQRAVMEAQGGGEEEVTEEVVEEE